MNSDISRVWQVECAASCDKVYANARDICIYFIEKIVVMADPQDLIVKKTWKAWRTRKVLTIDDLARLLDSSLATARRRLKTWNSLTSYNNNGRYYVLPDVPQFDAHGLWHYRDIGFSQYGNLTQTLIQLVHQSEAGLSASELGERLRLNPRSFLWLFRNHPDLRRDRRKGTSKRDTVGNPATTA